MIVPRLDGALSRDPFPHVRFDAILARADADGLLAWLRDEAPWRLRVESFYEQHEFSLLDADDALARDLTDPGLVRTLCDRLAAAFGERGLELADASAHRLTPGQTIRIHNDFIGEAETHRLLIQLNGGWGVERGGLLMLFADERPESVRDVVVPIHASGFAFEISPRSHHAVSSVRDGERFTLVYTFRHARRRPDEGVR